MATQPAPILEAAQREVSNLEAELSALRIRLATEERDLAVLQAERRQLAEAIATGKEKPAKASDLARKIEQAEAQVEGLSSLIRAKQPRVEELWGTIRREEAEAIRNSLLAEVGKLSTDGLAAIGRIEAAFTSTAADFEALARARTGLEYHAQDGLWAPMRGQAITEAAQHANKALAEFGNRLRLLSERTGWTPKR
jgi:chromosome segregation ATPase